MISKITKSLPYLLLCVLLLWAAWQGKEIRQLSADTRSIAESVSGLQEQQEAFAERIENIEIVQGELSENVLTLQSQIEEMKFKPLDIPLDESLQEFTYYRSREAGIQPEIIFALMWRESRYQVDAIGHNANGTYDSGLCQINSINHGWLAERGIDVSTPEGNIEACITILEMYMEKYTLEESLAAYGEGEGGMLAGRGFEAAGKLIERAENL